MCPGQCEAMMMNNFMAVELHFGRGSQSFHTKSGESQGAELALQTLNL